MTSAGLRITELAAQLDTSGPDTDSFRQARLTHLAVRANRLSARRHKMSRRAYGRKHQRLYRQALTLVQAERVPDADG
jgi:hypothetical protein